jgi:hypothetical protein
MPTEPSSTALGGEPSETPNSGPRGERATPSYAVGVFHDLEFGPDIVEYLHRIDETLAPFGGRFLVHGGPHEAIRSA